MKTTLLILALAAITATSTLRAEEAMHPPINPALLYWQAAAELPTLKEDQTKELRSMAAGQIAFDAAKAKELLNHEFCLHLMAMAANSTAPCDWGLPTEDGPEMALPHTSKMMEMASLAILKAEASFTEGKTKEGQDWLLITHRMARHAGAGDLLISNLVQISIETQALRAAARHCLGWDAEARKSYAASLQALPPMHTAQAAYAGERVFTDWLERKYHGPGGIGEIERLMQEVQGPNNVMKPEDKAAMVANLKPAAFEAGLAEWRSLQSQTEAALGEPWPQAQEELKALSEEAVHSTHFFIRAGYAEVTNVATKQYAATTLHTMLDAALEHGAQIDASVAASYHDAFEGNPLELRKSESGTLTLVASHKDSPHGKEISLLLGK